MVFASEVLKLGVSIALGPSDVPPRDSAPSKWLVAQKKNDPPSTLRQKLGKKYATRQRLNAYWGLACNASRAPVKCVDYHKKMSVYIAIYLVCYSG